ncbi:MAG: class B sortase [Collinsella sp.]|nr:class B sortase [Collinsella sp.]
MAAGSPRARRAPSPGEALPTAGAVSPSPVASHGIEPPAPPRRRSGKGSPSGSGEPPRRRRNVLSTILIALGTVLLIAAAAILIHALIGYRQAQATYDELRQYAVQDEAGDGVPVVDFDELARINPDVVGWIYVPGTVINYPVVQTDDNTTYLTRLFDLSGNGSGTIFMDMDDTAPGVVDEQTTLYGHHMNDGSMFKAIDDTLNQEAFDKIGKIYYITRENTFVFRPLFTSQVVDTYVDARKANFGDGETLAGYLDDIHGQAVSVAPDAEERMVGVDQVLSLVTCAGEILPRTTRAVMVCSLEETIPHQ